MIWLIFCAFILVLGAVLIGSGLLAHDTHWRNAAGWWAGVLISVTLFLMAQPFFQSLPEKVVQATRQSGCNTYQVDVKETDWDTFVNEVVQVDILSVAVGFIFCLLALEILQRWLSIPEKLIIFLFLALACAALSTLLYVFLIRKLCNLIFSFVLGAVVSVPIHIAFSAKRQNWRKRLDSLKNPKED